MKYPAKKDFGTAVAFLVFFIVLIGFGIFAIAIEGPGAGAVTVIAGIALALTVLLWVWFWFGTAYEINSSHVHIQLGPIKWRVKLDEIVEAVPTSSAWLMLGGTHVRLALSKDAIMIKARNKVLGVFPHAVLISPQDKPGFLKALAEASPDLEQLDDGSVRLRPEAAT